MGDHFAVSEQSTLDGGGEEDKEVEAANDTFMMEEGLELLAAYRSIADSAVRAAIKEVIRLLARRESATP